MAGLEGAGLASLPVRSSHNLRWPGAASGEAICTREDLSTHTHAHGGGEEGKGEEEKRIVTVTPCRRKRRRAGRTAMACPHTVSHGRKGMGGEQKHQCPTNAHTHTHTRELPGWPKLGTPRYVQRWRTAASFKDGDFATETHTTFGRRLLKRIAPRDTRLRAGKWRMRQRKSERESV